MLFLTKKGIKSWSRKIVCSLRHRWGAEWGCKDFQGNGQEHVYHVDDDLSRRWAFQCWSAKQPSRAWLCRPYFLALHVPTSPAFALPVPPLSLTAGSPAGLFVGDGKHKAAPSALESCTKHGLPPLLAGGLGLSRRRESAVTALSEWSARVCPVGRRGTVADDLGLWRYSGIEGHVVGTHSHVHSRRWLEELPCPSWKTRTIPERTPWTFLVVLLDGRVCCLGHLSGRNMCRNVALTGVGLWSSMPCYLTRLQKIFTYQVSLLFGLSP